MRHNNGSGARQVEDTLKELEAGSRRKFVPLNVRIAQAGLDCRHADFCLCRGGSRRLFCLRFFLITGAGFIVAAAMGFTASCGVPLWVLGFLKKRRETKFIEHFPDAVDMIVRGIKAGLPLLDSMKIIASESPNRSEASSGRSSRLQAIGTPLGEACMKLYERIPLPEANFFGIVVSIQQKAGGNLSEALGNLSKVLRDRKKMRAKIQAMSMEAKTSASSSPPCPSASCCSSSLTTPKYISLLWTEPLGRLMLVRLRRLDVHGRSRHEVK